MLQCRVKILTLFPLLLLVLSAGCAQVSGLTSRLMGNNFANYSQEEIDAFIVKGKTTQDEIRDKFGEPAVVEEDSTGVRWIYSTAGENAKLVSAATSAGAAAHVAGMASGASGSTAVAAGAIAAPRILTSSSTQTELRVFFNRLKVVVDYKWSKISM